MFLTRICSRPPKGEILYKHLNALNRKPQATFGTLSHLPSNPKVSKSRETTTRKYKTYYNSKSLTAPPLDRRACVPDLGFKVMLPLPIVVVIVISTILRIFVGISIIMVIIVVVLIPRAPTGIVG